MDCQRAQQLVSPYLDQQLTGAEMLEMQQHLAECGRCAEEYWAARQIKHLLRSLAPPPSTQTLERGIRHRLVLEERRPELPFTWPPLPAPPALSLPVSWPAPAPRGRRLAAALALSCLVVFTIAAPFAPGTADSAAAGQAHSAASMTGGLFVDASADTGLRVSPALAGGMLRPAVATVAAPLPPGPGVARDMPLPLGEAGAEPLGDEAVSGYAGGVVLTGYRR